jgi:hypothetical protein
LFKDALNHMHLNVFSQLHPSEFALRSPNGHPALPRSGSSEIYHRCDTSSGPALEMLFGVISRGEQQND